MESKPQNREFRNNPENFHPCIKRNVMDQDVSFSLEVSFPSSNIYRDIMCLFVCFDSLHPSLQFFSHVWMGLPGLNQY